MLFSPRFDGDSIHLHVLERIKWKILKGSANERNKRKPFFLKMKTVYQNVRVGNTFALIIAIGKIQKSPQIHIQNCECRTKLSRRNNRWILEYYANFSSCAFLSFNFSLFTLRISIQLNGRNKTQTKHIAIRIYTVQMTLWNWWNERWLLCCKFMGHRNWEFSTTENWSI